MRDKYEKLIEQYTGGKYIEISDDLSFRDDFSMDSLSLAMLYPEIEDAFNVTFSPLNDDLGEIFKTVGTLWHFIELRGSYDGEC